MTENLFEVKEEKKVEVLKDTKVREDLHNIVKDIKFLHQKTSFGYRNVCNVTFFNDKVVEFKDSDGIYELFASYVEKGEKDFIKSCKLVEEIQTEESTGNAVRKYICVRYDLADGGIYRLFATKFVSNKIIDNYYDLYKSQTKTSATK